MYFQIFYEYSESELSQFQVNDINYIEPQVLINITSYYIFTYHWCGQLAWQLSLLHN